MHDLELKGATLHPRMDARIAATLKLASLPHNRELTTAPAVTT